MNEKLSRPQFNQMDTTEKQTLMESHPEENNYGKHKQQSYDTLFSLFRSQLLFYHCLLYTSYRSMQSEHHKAIYDWVA